MRRMKTFCLLLSLGFAALVSAQTSYPGGHWSPPIANYSTTAPDSLTIDLPDGNQLRAQVYFPAEKGSSSKKLGASFPVIVEMSPYPNLRVPLSPIDYMTHRGYIYAVVRPRGSGGSTGELQQFSSIDGMDGAAVARWAANLPGSDGRVGYYGCSYAGGTALATAAYVGPDSPVKATVCACIGLDMQHRQVWTTNGLPNAALTAYAPVAESIMGGVPSATQYFEGFYANLMAGGPEAYDGYWDHRLPLDWATRIVRNNIPTLFWTGWDDINESGALNATIGMQNAAAGLPVMNKFPSGVKADPRFQLIMGNWGHAQGLDPGLVLQWFETWLKGEDTGIEKATQPFHLYEENRNQWVNLDHYPPVMEYSSYQLSADGRLVKEEVIEGSSTLRYTAPNDTSGKLSFVTPQINDGATLAGPMSVKVYASSTNTNMALLASLYDVAPNGDAQRISFGAILGSQKQLDPERSWTDEDGNIIRPWPTLRRDERLIPGRTYELHIPLAARQWSIEPGHRLRLELSTQSDRGICPDEGRVAFASEPCRLTQPQQTTLPGGIYTLYFGKENASCLHLPLLPYLSFETVRSAPPAGEWTDDKSLPYLDFTLPLDWGSK